VREHHWSPQVIAGLFLDNLDEFGLIYWYDDIIASYKEAPKPKK